MTDDREVTLISQSQWEESLPETAKRLRAEADEVEKAMKVLGNTAGLFIDVREYRSLQSRMNAYTGALRHAATLIAADAAKK